MNNLLVRALAVELEAEKAKAEVKVLNRALRLKEKKIKFLYKAIIENNKVMMMDFHRNIEKVFNVEGQIMAEEFSTFREVNLVCPYCGVENENSWEYIGEMGDGDKSEATCNDCEKDFKFTLNVDVSFTSKKG